MSNTTVANTSSTGYLIRRLNREQFEVSSWNDDTRPKGVYVLTRRSKNTFSCDCPARGVKRCRHVSIVKRFIENERSWDPYVMVNKDGDRFSRTRE